MTNTLTNIRKSAGGHSGQGSCLYPQKAGPKVPESTQYQDFDVPTHLHTQEVTGSSPVVSTIKKATPDGCGLFCGIRGNLKCSLEVNSASAKVLPAAKRLYGANAPPCHTAPVSFMSTRHPSPWNRKIPGGFCSRHTPRSPSHTGEGNSLSSGRTGRNAFPPRLQGTLQLCKVRCFGRFYR